MLDDRYIKQKSLRDIIQPKDSSTQSWFDHPDVFEKFKEMDKQGKAHELPKFYNKSKSTITRIFNHFKQKHGYERLSNGLSLTHPAHEAKLKELDKAGVSLNTISSTLGFDKKTIKSNLRRLANSGYERTARKPGRPSNFWTDDKLKELDKHLENPKTQFSEIAQKLGTTKEKVKFAVNSKYIGAKLKNSGIARQYSPPKGPRWMTPEHRETIIKMDQEKKTYPEIGAAVKQPAYAIKNALNHLAASEGYKRSDRSENSQKNRNFIKRLGKLGKNK